jgi:hypothetical protein
MLYELVKSVYKSKKVTAYECKRLGHDLLGIYDNSSCFPHCLVWVVSRPISQLCQLKINMW